MKTVVLLLLASSFPAHSQTNSDRASDRLASLHRCNMLSAEQAIIETAEKWKQSYNSGNADEIATLYDDNAYYLTQHFTNGIIQGRAKIKDYFQRGVDAGFHINSIEIVATGCSNDLAYSIARYESTNSGRKAFGVNLVVLKTISDKWLIVAHESAVPDPATAVRSLDTPPGH